MLRGHLWWRRAVEGSGGVPVPAVLPSHHSRDLYRFLLPGCHQGPLEISQVFIRNCWIDILIILDDFQRCPKFDRGVSVRQQRHHPVSPLHSAPGQGIVCQVSWARQPLTANGIQIGFCSFSLPSDSHVDSGQQRQPERDTRHGRDSLQMTSLKNSENSTKFCSCKQFR